MLIALVGIAIPVAIHLYGGRNARTVKFAALEFLVESDNKTTRKWSVERWVLLVLRMVVIALIVTVAAKPWTDESTTSVSIGAGGAVVIIVDNGFSSTFEHNDGVAIEWIRKQALDIVDGVEPGAKVALVTTSSTESTELTDELQRVRDAIAGVRSTHRRGDSQAAVQLAATLLSAATGESKTVVVISPMARATWDGTDWSALADTRVVPISVLDGIDTTNVAVTNVQVDHDLSAGPRGVRVTATTLNTGDTPQSRELRLNIGGTITARARLNMAPGATETKTFAATVPADVAATEISVELDPDALPADDRRYTVAGARAPIRALLVNGSPRPTRYDDELYYITTALDAGGSHATGIHTRSTTVGDLGTQPLSNYDVVVLANTVALSERTVEKLERWIQGGGGLLIAVGDNVEPESYNAVMAPLLVQPLSDTVTATDARSPARRLGKIDIEHPAMTTFSTSDMGLHDAVFNTRMLVRPTPNSGDRQVLIQYEDGASALLEARRGAGRVALLTTTLDREWSTLCIHPGYVPLLQRYIRYLARRPMRASALDIIAGDIATVALQPDDTAVQVLGPDGKRFVFGESKLRGRRRLRFRETTLAGFYKVKTASSTRPLRDRPQAMFAVNIDPAVSTIDIKPIPAREIGETTGRQPSRRKKPMWPTLGAAVLAAVLFESLWMWRRG